jgi:histidyl-tRNA synthetase
MKAQMKAANRSQAPIAVIIGEDELSAGTVSVRTMRSAPVSRIEGAAAGSIQSQVDRSQLIETVRSLLP